jgi:hypothetical protein
MIRPKFVGVFYYDTVCWPVAIPLIWGSHELKTPECLQQALFTMPPGIWTSLSSDPEWFHQLLFLWMDCFDYGYGIDQLVSPKSPTSFARDVLTSGHQHLQATIGLLLGGTISNDALPKAIEELAFRRFSSTVVGRGPSFGRSS